MAEERKHYAKYVYNVGLDTFWKGDAHQAGSQFRSIAVTTNHFSSTVGPLQVYAIEGVGKGVENGKFAGAENEKTELIFDQDFSDGNQASEAFTKIGNDALRDGFKRITFWDIVAYEARLKDSNR